MAPPVEVVLSRFGVMFFDDPHAAFSNLAEATIGGGRFSFSCWDDVAHNEWILAPAAAISPLVELPPPSPPGMPGPFAFADVEAVAALLEEAGWTDLTIESIDDPLYLGGPGTVARTVDFAVRSMRGITDAMEGFDSERREEVRRRLTGEFSRHHDGIGVRYRARAHLIRAIRDS
ncbi:MAG: hypothetical protein R2698_02835 [Microthrixaceae bacterium]